MTRSRMPQMFRELSARQQASLAAGFVLPLVFSLIGVAILLTAHPQLPELIATHWGFDGTPDGFSTFPGVVAATLSLGVVLPWMMAAFGWVNRRPAEMGAAGVGTGLFTVVLVAGSTLAQVGIADPRAEAVSLAVPLATAIVAGLAAGVGFLLVFRPSRRRVAVDISGSDPRLLVGDEVRIAWTGWTAIAGGVRLLAVAAIACMLVMVLPAVFAGRWGYAAIHLAAAIVLGFLFALMSSEIVINHHGVRVLGMGVVPWKTIRLWEISGASVRTDISALGEWGGWGLRISFDGHSGFITASGSGLAIHRGERPDYVITLDDCEQAAATLNALVARRSG